MNVWPLTLNTCYFVANKLSLLQCILCEVIKLCTKLDQISAIRGGVIAISVYDLVTLKMALRVVLGSWIIFTKFDLRQLIRAWIIAFLMPIRYVKVQTNCLRTTRRHRSNTWCHTPAAAAMCISMKRIISLTTVPISPLFLSIWPQLGEDRKRKSSKLLCTVCKQLCQQLLQVILTASVRYVFIKFNFLWVFRVLPLLV